MQNICKEGRSGCELLEFFIWRDALFLYVCKEMVLSVRHMTLILTLFFNFLSWNFDVQSSLCSNNHTSLLFNLASYILQGQGHYLWFLLLCVLLCDYCVIFNFLPQLQNTTTSPSSVGVLAAGRCPACSSPAPLLELAATQLAGDLCNRDPGLRKPSEIHVWGGALFLLTGSLMIRWKLGSAAPGRLFPLFYNQNFLS